MASPLIPCDTCGAPIADSDLETGSAITVLGRTYCPGCKGDAIQRVSLEDLAAKPESSRSAAPKTPSRAAAAPPKAAPAPAPPPKPAPPKPAAKIPNPVPEARPVAKAEPPAAKPALQKPATRRVPRAAAPASRLPLVIGLAAVVVILVVVAAVVLSKGGSTPARSGKNGDPPPGVPNPPADSGTKDRETLAREAYLKVEGVSRQANASWDLVLAAVEKAKPACRGTSWEPRLEEIRSKAAREKELEDAARDLTPLIDEIRGIAATDPEFKRYAELQPKFHLAREIAGKTASARMTEIQALQKDYNGRYEKAAEPYYNDINEAAVALSDEKRYDDALRKIETFPQYLRHSGAWLSLERLKKDIESRKKK